MTPNLSKPQVERASKFIANLVNTNRQLLITEGMLSSVIYDAYCLDNLHPIGWKGFAAMLHSVGLYRVTRDRKHFYVLFPEAAIV